MKIGALTLFVATSDPKRKIIAAWHSRRSLTWRWCLDFVREPSRQAYVAFRYQPR